LKTKEKKSTKNPNRKVNRKVNGPKAGCDSADKIPARSGKRDGKLARNCQSTQDNPLRNISKMSTERARIAIAHEKNDPHIWLRIDDLGSILHFRTLEKLLKWA